jgi:hypothetical protein
MLSRLRYAVPAIGILTALTLAGCQAANQATAPAPTAEPAPVVTASISGTVTLKGPVEQNSTILLLGRKIGDKEYTAIDRKPAVNNTAFEYPNAREGETYEITAALQVNEQNTATGNELTVTAPALNQIITIDTGVNLPPPQELPIVVSCGNPDATNHYNVTLSVPKIATAKAYYAEVGTTAGSDDTFAKGFKAPTQEFKAYVEKGRQYFSRYAYTLCTDCLVTDTGNWSSWSPTLGFVCQ